MSSPADFYTGLVADLYRPLRSAAPDPAPYERFIRRVGQPALELGCGDGDPLLALLDAGLEVHGLDSSGDMLARLRSRPEAAGRALVLFESPMEAMDLGRTYPAIFLAGPTFNLLPDDGVALASLRRIRAHLALGGEALVPLFVPAPTPPAVLGAMRTELDEVGRTMRFGGLAEERDEEARVQRAVLRYERVDVGGAVEAVERTWLLHWYTPAGFTALAEQAGLAVVEATAPGRAPVTESSTAFRFRLAPR